MRLATVIILCCISCMVDSHVLANNNGLIRAPKCTIKDSILSITIGNAKNLVDHVSFIDVRTNRAGELSCKTNSTTGKLVCQIQGRTTSKVSALSDSYTLKYIIFSMKGNDFKKICIATGNDYLIDVDRGSTEESTVVDYKDRNRRYRIIKGSGHFFLGLVLFVIVFLLSVVVVWKVCENQDKNNQKHQDNPNEIHLTVDSFP